MDTTEGQQGETVPGEDKPPEKKNRKRTKQLCKDIRQQMEFYFGDANLNKDRFMKKEIDKTQDGWLKLEMFARFNRMKKLTTDESMMSKALSTSNIIEVSEDRKSVRRKLPLVDAKDVDDRTIYVECLPKDVDHDWVKKVFAPYGKVLYVSLPRFRSTGKFKGFAFVEFDSVQSAKTAIEEMNNPPALASDKPGVFPCKGSKDIVRIRNQLEYFEGGQKKHKRKRTLSDPPVSDSPVVRESKPHKRSRTLSEGDQTHCTPLKKTKISPESDEKESELDSSKENIEQSTAAAHSQHKSGKGKTKRKRKLCDGDKNTDEKSQSEESKRVKVEENVGAELEKTDKKKKNRSKKNSIKNEKTESAIPELRVLSKAEWLELKIEYVTIQKTNMVKLKQSLQEYKKAEQEVTEDPLQEPMEQCKHTDKREKDRTVPFLPNVIVRVECHMSIQRVELKEKVKEFGSIAYIDVDNGSTEGYIRCGDETTAVQLADAHVANHNFSLLTGEAETRYWEKLTADKEKKLNSKSKRKKRGKEKLEEKAEETKREVLERKHVIFDDD